MTTKDNSYFTDHEDQSLKPDGPSQPVVQEPELVSQKKMNKIRRHSGSQSDQVGRLMSLASRLEAMGEEIREMILDPESGRYFSDIHTYKEGE